MASLLLISLFVIFGLEVVLAQGSARHSIVWDRFWIKQHLSNSLLVVQLHDRIDLLCWVNSSEAVQDKYENVMFLTEEEDVNNCNGTINTTKKFAECLGAIDIIIDITDHKLATKLSFEPGETYYLTSFSDGTVDGARHSITHGGACTLEPPLKLTISVLGNIRATVYFAVHCNREVTLKGEEIQSKTTTSFPHIMRVTLINCKGFLLCPTSTAIDSTFSVIDPTSSVIDPASSVIDLTSLVIDRTSSVIDLNSTVIVPSSSTALSSTIMTTSINMVTMTATPTNIVTSSSRTELTALHSTMIIQILMVITLNYIIV